MVEWIGYSRSATAIALTDAKSCTALKALTAEATSEKFPHKCLLDWLHGEITGIAGGATGVIWNLAWDAAGDIPMTPEITTLITPGKTNPATKGAVMATIGRRILRPAGVGEADIIYLVARTNVVASTLNLTPRVYHVK